ncbi:hypothetical protein K435DRAFT_796540 [Dendrothele bispora CBS 962.96]|uniref:Uncharacterized protein n=1 Tax=Dendrothele bispora (strain CBS 962.96) TaxID=1314807 RepID=A0A4V4HG43_DENBC|nr:hypothetical protein K435DRAFT_796540 [Dendrothele bispora CBS 962.96]
MINTTSNQRLPPLPYLNLPPTPFLQLFNIHLLAIPCGVAMAPDPDPPNNCSKASMFQGDDVTKNGPIGLSGYMGSVVKKRGLRVSASFYDNELLGNSKEKTKTKNKSTIHKITNVNKVTEYIDVDIDRTGPETNDSVKLEWETKDDGWIDR